MKDLPHHHSVLQRAKHPETALSAEMSVWQGPSVAGSGQGRRRGSTGPGAPEAAPRPGFSPAPEAGRCRGGRRVPETHSQGKDTRCVPIRGAWAVPWPVRQHIQEYLQHCLHSPAQGHDRCPHGHSSSVGSELVHAVCGLGNFQSGFSQAVKSTQFLFLIDSKTFPGCSEY